MAPDTFAGIDDKAVIHVMVFSIVNCCRYRLPAMMCRRLTPDTEEIAHPEARPNADEQGHPDTITASETVILPKKEIHALHKDDGPAFMERLSCRN
jgi:hypothetical protein